MRNGNRTTVSEIASPADPPPPSAADRASNYFSSPAPQSPPPPVPGAQGQPIIAGVRPWWGPIDALIGVMMWIGGLLLVGFASFAAAQVAGVDLDNLEDVAWLVVFGAILQQVTQVLWPWVISKWKGLGLRTDWGLSFKAIDLGIGLGLAILLVILATAASYGVAELVGLDSAQEASNTGILTDHESSPWVIGIIFAVVIGAPFSEELFFRGLLLRTIQRGAGPVVAVIASTLIFMLPHFVPGRGWEEAVVLWASIGVIGLVLGIAAVKFDRLGPVIVAHVLFNGWGTLASLLI